jgi:hypothetical protein
MERLSHRFCSAVLFGLLLLSGGAVAGSLEPVYDNLQTEEGSFFAVRPFYSRTELAEGEIQDFLWPLYSRKSFKEEQSSRALFVWITHRFDVDEENPRTRRWLLPFYFQGRDALGNGYFALFPLGGTIHEFLGRDEITFALFPLFGKSRINDVKTTSVLWPVYSRTRGEGIRRDRVFPLAGKSVLEDKYEKRFILWPFWTAADYFHPGDSGSAWILFPLIGRAEMDNERTLWLLPPFFRFTKGEKEDRLFCPWPFIQVKENEWHSKLYVWPLWGRDRFDGGLKHRTFALWPLLWSERTERENLTKIHRMALPFFYLERDYLNEPDVPEKDRKRISNYWKIWPLMSWQREQETSRFRLLELWPIKNSPPIERNWAPLWTLFKRTDHEGIIRKELLWFLWQSEREKDAGRSEWSLLKGLLSYKKDADGGGDVLRLFWIPFSGE